MTFRTLILRSLRHHARAHLGVLLGAAVGSAVLVGALLVGDSVRGSLREMALARLGNIHVALASGDRWIREGLAADLYLGGMIRHHPGLVSPDNKWEKSGAPWVAPAIQLHGTVANSDASARANQVQILGIDQRFLALSDDETPFESMPKADSAVLNERLAAHLAVQPGDTILIRLPKPSALSRDAPLSPEEDTSLALRLPVSAIATDAQLGRFSLQANQVGAFNVFLPLKLLQRRLDQTNRVNLLVAGWHNQVTNSPVGTSVTMPGWSDVTNAALLGTPMPRPAVRSSDPAEFVQPSDLPLRPVFRLADAEMELVASTNTNVVELRTPRVFIDEPVVQAAMKAAPDAQPLLTYFVNELRAGDQAAPYSMVTAAGQPWVPADMRDDEILITQWLADDLGAKAGDLLALRYYIVGNARKLEERTNTFTIRAIVPAEMPWADPTLMPDFPGLKDAENCRDWDTGFPIDMDRIREHDNQYWEDFKGTPKAFVTLAAGQKMWANRFGSLTAIRWPKGTGGAIPFPEHDFRGSVQDLLRAEIEHSLLRKLDPASVGLVFQPVREQALKAVNESQDFGGLFIGFSFFLIVAALLLMALLFQFGIEQRAPEIGTLLALGYTPKQVRRLLLGEGAVLSVLGGLIGLAGGIGYAKAMLWGLSTLWRDAVGTSSLAYHAQPQTLVIGAVAGSLVGLFTIWLAVRRQAGMPARVLLSGGTEEYSVASLSPHPDPLPKEREQPEHAGSQEGGLRAEGRGEGERPLRFKPRSKAPWIALGSMAIALVMIGWALTQDSQNPGLFFGAGSLLLIAAMAATSSLLTRLQAAQAATTPRLNDLGLRNATRQRRRSLATVAMLACGSFLVVAVGANKLDATKDATQRSSGTGGFALIGETTLPVVHDLNAQAGRDFFGIDAKDVEGVSFVPFRVREGDDASCLNLNRAQKPRLLGVNPSALADKNAFTFAKKFKKIDSVGWESLNHSFTDGAVPAIGDAASIQWALDKHMGEVIPYVDERGNSFNIRFVGGLANSILQGSLIISEDEFVKRFPSEAGYRMFLIDTPSDKVSEVSATLSKALQDVGLELTPAPQRLAQYNAVQNTYLSTFQVLGGLGLLLGSVGLGVVVLRNVLERRSELALLLAVGFRRRAVRWLVMSEHGALLVLGLLGGVVAAVVAVLPSLLSPGAEIPYASLAGTLGAVLLSGWVWTWLAARVALRGRLLDALRNE
jgi:putative ABC transport system permease protein